MLFYVLGGLAMAGKLSAKHLPTAEVVGQLPREFLLSEAFKVLGWALLAGIIIGVCLLVGWALAHKSLQFPEITAVRAKGWFSKHWFGFTIAVLICLSAGWTFEVFARPLSLGIACQKNGHRPVSGWYIGQSGDRTYIGELAGLNGTPRIASLPNDMLGFVFIGGGPEDDFGVRMCKSFAHRSSLG